MHNRKSIRLKRYNYNWPGYYFVTICTKDRSFSLCQVFDSKTILNKFGKITHLLLHDSISKYKDIELDVFAIMPNHIHFILKLNTDYVDHIDTNIYFRRKNALAKFIGYFKMRSAKEINICLKNSGNSFWQRNYYEKIINNCSQLEAIREYIVNNPKKWEQDKNNPSRSGNT